MLNERSKFQYKKYRGDSFSETLIVMVILGIVFTLSLGIIIADYKKNKLIVRLQKSFYTIEQAFNLARIENSAPENWDIRNNDSYSFFKQYLKPYLVITKDCKNSLVEGCNFEFKELNGNQTFLNSDWVRFILKDGMFIAMQTRINKNDKVVYFYVDINGKKHLNVVGRDIFMFEYWLESTIHPEWVGLLFPCGHEYSRLELLTESNENNCNSNKNGNYCASVIWKDGWQMKQGYPWAQARYIVK